MNRREDEFDDDRRTNRDDGAEDNQGEAASPASLLLTAAQAAELLCISEATLWELVRRDRLRCVQFVATGFQRPMRRFRLQDLEKFIEDAVG